MGVNPLTLQNSVNACRSSSSVGVARRWRPFRSAMRHTIPPPPCRPRPVLTPYPVRVQRLLTRPRRSRATTLALCALLATSVAFAIAAPASAKTKKPVAKVTIGDVTIYKVGNAPDAMPDDVRAKILAAVSTYLNAATVKPLQTGVVDDASL